MWLVPLWELFLDLNSSRPPGMGASGIPLTEVEAWCRLRDVRLTDWELDVLIGMDKVVLSTWGEARKNAQPKEKKSNEHRKP